MAQIILAKKGFYGAARLCSRSRADRQAAERYFRSFRGNYDTPVGLIGLGAIGAGVARRLVQDYRLTVYAYDPFCTQERAAELGVRLADPDEIFSTCLFATTPPISPRHADCSTMPSFPVCCPTQPSSIRDAERR